MHPFRALTALIFCGYSACAMAVETPLSKEECEAKLTALKTLLQSTAGFSEAEKAGFAAHGQIHPHSLRNEPLSVAISALEQLPPGEKVHELSAEDIGLIIKDRQKEITPELQTQIESLLGSSDRGHIEAALIALNQMKGISAHAQLKIADLIGDTFHAGRAVEVLAALEELAPEAYERVVQLAAENSRAGRHIWFTHDPEKLLMKINPVEMEKDQALRSAGLTEQEILDFNQYGVISPRPIVKMDIAKLVHGLVNLEQGQLFEGSDVGQIGQVLRSRHAELTPQLQVEIEGLLASVDEEKIKAVFEILEKMPRLGGHAQEVVAQLTGNKALASAATFVLGIHKKLEAQAYQIVAERALDNSRKGLKPDIIEDPERLLKKLSPQGITREQALENAGFTEAERKDFELYGEIHPHPLKKMSIDQVVDKLSRLAPGEEFEGRGVEEIGEIVRSRWYELTEKEVLQLENLLESSNLRTVNSALLALASTRTISSQAQLKIASLAAKSETSRNAMAVLRNLRKVSGDTYGAIAALALSSADRVDRPSFDEDPEHLLGLIQPIEEGSSPAPPDERVTEEQASSDHQLRTGETDISEDWRHRNLIELQRKAASFFLRGSYVNMRPKTIYRWRTAVSQPQPYGDYSGVFVVTTGGIENLAGKSAMEIDAVTEFDPEFHRKFNLPTRRSAIYQALEKGQLFHYVREGDHGDWHAVVTYGEPAGNKTIVEGEGPSKRTHVWSYVGAFQAPNGIRYKKCYQLTTIDSDDREVAIAIFTPGIGAVYTRSEWSETYLEGIEPRR